MQKDENKHCIASDSMIRQGEQRALLLDLSLICPGHFGDGSVFVPDSLGPVPQVSDWQGAEGSCPALRERFKGRAKKKPSARTRRA